MSQVIDGVIGGTRSPGRRLSGESLSRSGAGEMIRRDPRLGGHLAARERSPESLRPGERNFVARQLPKKYSAATHKKSWKERLQLPLIVIGGMLAGFAIQNALLGQMLIAGYGIFAFIYRIPSRITFMGALAALLVMFAMLFFTGNLASSQTFAVYTFLLLVVGVITLNREVKREGGRIYSRRYR